MAKTKTEKKKPVREYGERFIPEVGWYQMLEQKYFLQKKLLQKPFLWWKRRTFRDWSRTHKPSPSRMRQPSICF